MIIKTNKILIVVIIITKLNMNNFYNFIINKFIYFVRNLLVKKND